MYNLIGYSDHYLKRSRSLWQYYRDKLVLSNGFIVDYTGNNNSDSFNFNEKKNK